MFFHAPAHIRGAHLRIFMDDLLSDPKTVSEYLRVSERTVYSWLSTGQAPRAAVLALFWESQYGRSQIFTDQVNEIRLLYRQVCLLREQFQRAKDIITGLRAMHAGSANEPLFDELLDLGTPSMPSFHLGDELPAALVGDATMVDTAPAPASRRVRDAMKAFDANRRARKA